MGWECVGMVGRSLIVQAGKTGATTAGQPGNPFSSHSADRVRPGSLQMHGKKGVFPGYGKR
jgi:hypothetical protein